MAGILASSLSFGSLHFLLLTQIRIAHIFHPAPKPGISLNVLHIQEDCVQQDRNSASLERPADAVAKTTVHVFITVSSLRKLLFVRLFFSHLSSVHQHSCTKSKPHTIVRAVLELLHCHK